MCGLRKCLGVTACVGRVHRLDAGWYVGQIKLAHAGDQAAIFVVVRHFIETRLVEDMPFSRLGKRQKLMGGRIRTLDWRRCDAIGRTALAPVPECLFDRREIERL